MTEDLIAEAITEAFGERCPDYGEHCPCCQAWKQYDESKGLQIRVEELTRARDVLIKAWRGADSQICQLLAETKYPRARR